jgi:hypothetical protein
MSLVLDGTNGLSEVDGSAATPAIRGTDTNTGIFFPAADTIAFAEGGAEVARFDASGNMGLGTTSAATRLHVVSDSSQVGRFIRNNTGNASGGVDIGNNTRIWTLYGDNSSLSFWDTTAGAERARIDSSGNLLVGTTTTPAQGARFSADRPGGGNYFSFGPNNTNAFIVYNSATTGVFLVNGATAWSANSDERLKTEITSFENAAAKVCTLRAGTGRYLTDDETVSRSFLIAQDVQAVLPEAVDVQADEQGTLGLRYTDVVPLLVAAIQEQQAIITALTARVEALDARLISLEGTQP